MFGNTSEFNTPQVLLSLEPIEELRRFPEKAFLSGHDNKTLKTCEIGHDFTKNVLLGFLTWKRLSSNRIRESPNKPEHGRPKASNISGHPESGVCLRC